MFLWLLWNHFLLKLFLKMNNLVRLFEGVLATAYPTLKSSFFGQKSSTCRSTSQSFVVTERMSESKGEGCSLKHDLDERKPGKILAELQKESR